MAAFNINSRRARQRYGFLYRKGGRHMMSRRRLPRGLLKGRPGIFKTKVHGVITVFNNTGGGTDISQSYSLNFPTYLRDIDGLIKQLGTKSKHYQKCFSMFDEYKVNRLSLQIRHPNITAPLGAVALTPTGNNNYPIIHTARDDDSDDLIVDVASALTTVGMKRHQTYTGRAIRVSMRPKYLDRQKWFNTSSLNPGQIPNEPNTITDKMPPRGSIKVFMENVANSNLAFDIMATWQITFRGLNNLQNSANTEIYKDPQGFTGAYSHPLPDDIYDSYTSIGNSGAHGGTTSGYIPISFTI